MRSMFTQTILSNQQLPILITSQQRYPSMTISLFSLLSILPGKMRWSWLLWLHCLSHYSNNSQVRVVYSFGPQYLHSTGQFHKATAKAHLASLSKLTPDGVAVQEAGFGIERGRLLRKNVYRTGHFLFVEAADSVDFDVTGLPYTFAQMIKRQARMDARHMKMSEQLSETTPSLINCGVDVAGCLRKFSAFLRRTEV